MPTQDYHLSAPEPIRLRFQDESGALMNDLDFRLSLPLGSTCELIAGVLRTDGDWDFDLSGLALLPRLYPVSVQSNDGAGWVYLQSLNVNVIGGC